MHPLLVQSFRRSHKNKTRLVKDAFNSHLFSVAGPFAVFFFNSRQQHLILWFKIFSINVLSEAAFINFLKRKRPSVSLIHREGHVRTYVSMHIITIDFEYEIFPVFNANALDNFLKKPGNQLHLSKDMTTTFFVF